MRVKWAMMHQFDSVMFLKNIYTKKSYGWV